MISSVCFSENFRQVARAAMKSLALHCAGGFHRQRHWRVHKEEATGAWSQCAEECLAHCRDLATLGHQRRSCFFVAIKSRCRGHAERQCKWWVWFFMIFPYSRESSSSFHGLRNTEGVSFCKKFFAKRPKTRLAIQNETSESMESMASSSMDNFTLCWDNDNHGLMDQWIPMDSDGFVCRGHERSYAWATWDCAKSLQDLQGEVGGTSRNVSWHFLKTYLILTCIWWVMIMIQLWLWYILTCILLYIDEWWWGFRFPDLWFGLCNFQKEQELNN